jgi:hypothetical protein
MYSIKKHFHLYEQIENLTIKEFKEKLNKSFKFPIGDLKLTDLIYEKRSLNGVYIIYDMEDKPAYIGKAGSRAFLERIAAHLDLRINTPFNSFLRALARNDKNLVCRLSEINEEQIKEVYENALKHKIVLIELHDKDRTKRLESILCRELKPSLNSNKDRKPYKIDTKIKDI